MTEELNLDGPTVRALGLELLDRKSVAHRLAEIGGLKTPSREETEAFLVEVLVSALGKIPVSEVAWSWGEFHNGGIQPLYDMGRAKDWTHLAVCAADLGVAEDQPTIRDGENLTPLDGLARNLGDATEQLLLLVRERLEAVGVSPYGPPATPPPT